ncbi:endonuclease III domain-containing protein [Mucilaginibacter aquatilis]|uniref:Fe-S cluster assembly protein HesB n=1 Tax=Mucilaginibacter aquatilis TaxID=1517760 RepID=A0A6I4ID72_9SPHI|nr:Fe-S cluster assembly protein HesB [Mucilaginibacter aquatilis]MVN93112.1 Fe-S cluster assembly protein HesB [Mucilaginibacter aquatilis]
MYDVKDFVLEVHNRLYAVYGSQIRYFHDYDPLSELVSTLLSHRTKNSHSAEAFTNLQNAFGSWESVRDADVAEVQVALKPCTWPEQKAPRLQQVLRLITEQRGELNLDFLAGMNVDDARTWLESFPGVGPKSSAAVISFSNLRGRALPVDSHHYRVAVRLGLIDVKIGEGKANRILENQLPAEFTAKEMFDHHQVMMRHGQKVCFYLKPACGNCVLLDSCETGRKIASAGGEYISGQPPINN